MNSRDINLVADYADRLLELEAARESEGGHYQSLPLCVIDAVYSIGVHFRSVERVVDRYCRYFGLRKFREAKGKMPPENEQQSISDLCRKMEEMGIERFCDEVFGNRQRTSTKNGILKAEAVCRVASVLKAHGGEFLQDVPRLRIDSGFEADIREIPGQRSGVSLQAFYMLAGADDLIKPDRMVLRFLQGAIGRTVTLSEAQSLVSEAASQLREKYPLLTPRLLDLEIWKYQREQKPV